MPPGIPGLSRLAIDPMAPPHWLCLFVGHDTRPRSFDEEMTTDKRAVARQLAAEAGAEMHPLEWFETLYQRARDEGATVPWADRVPNPHVIPLVKKLPTDRSIQRALKIGCGYGDDAEWLERQGFDVTAFDISPTAIAMCRQRFPNSRVRYLVADLFEPADDWNEHFQLVWESYTLQVLPPDLRKHAIEKMCQFVSNNGHLVFASRAREESDQEGDMPWPLTRSEVDTFSATGLSEVYFEDYTDNESPPVRRFRACFKKVSNWTMTTGQD